MTRVSFSHQVGDLASDLKTIAATAGPRMTAAVTAAVTEGHGLAQAFARESSGPHGKAYYRRITAEMLGPLSGEFGPTGDVDGNAVGAGWRHGVNTDLPRAADVIGPKLAANAGDILDDLFWPT